MRNFDNGTEMPFVEEGSWIRRDRKTIPPSSNDNAVWFIKTCKGPEKMPQNFQSILEPPKDDPTMVALFATINQTNALIHQLGERIKAMEKDLHSRSPCKDNNGTTLVSSHLDNRVASRC